MSEEMDFTPELYTLVDEEGKEQMFEMLDAIEQDDKRYFALVPYYTEPEELVDDEGELVILRAELVGDEEMLVSIDDDEEFDKIGAIFMQRIEEMFDEDDDGCDDDACSSCGGNCGHSH